MEVEHADILELNTIIGTLRKENELVEQDKVGVYSQMETSLGKLLFLYKLTQLKVVYELSSVC